MSSYRGIAFGNLLYFKHNSSASILCRLNTRAASGTEKPESRIENPRLVPDGKCKIRNAIKRESVPSDNSPSKCLEKGYGKPLKPTRRSLFNFCKGIIRVKEKPSNCDPCPPESKRKENFWDYLFKFDDKIIPEPSTCRIAHRHREACRKTDPRLSDPRYRRTQGDVLIFTELPRPPCCISNEPQPRSPPAFKLPKAVACRHFVKNATAYSSSFRYLAKNKDEAKIEPGCSGPRSFRIPFEECRPHRKSRESFSCVRGIRGNVVSPPMATDRGTCGGRSVGEILAEATIPQMKSKTLENTSFKISKIEPRANLSNNYSRFQRLQKLTEASNCKIKQNSK